MIGVNNWRDLVSPLPLAAKPKKGKSQTVTSTSPKSQGHEASGALSKKSKRPKSKQPPIETNVTPTKPTEGILLSRLLVKARLKPRHVLRGHVRIKRLYDDVRVTTAQVIVNGDSISLVASASAEGPIPPKTAEQKLARKNELKAKSTLMLVIPNEYLLKFHACKDAKSLCEAIKNRFRGNKESKKMQKTILKQNYEKFVASSQEGLDKTYDRFQKIISQLEIHELSGRKRTHKLWSNGIYILRFIKFRLEGYQMGLESLDDRIVIHEKNEAVYEEDIAFLKYDVQVKDISIKEIKNQLENALKEKDDMKLKLEKFETSSKNLTKLINSQISAIDKTGLGYDGQMNESDLNDIHVNESEVLNNVFDSHESNGDDNQVNDRFKKGKGYHAVPPPYTGNYMPPRADLSFLRLDNSIFKSKVSETITSVPKIETNASETSKDSLKKPKTVRSSAPLIEEWELDSEDENVFKPKKATTLVSAVRHVNIAASRLNMNNALPTTYSYFKAHSPVRRTFDQKSAAKTNNFSKKVYSGKVNDVTTAGPKAVVSAVEGNRNNVVNPQHAGFGDQKEI
nr:ribonuclease H-like domain-containing protein [Tanacetum cinerariifolium]